jgi:hypothetical protein
MNVKYWRMSCVGVNGDFFGLLWNLNEIGNFNKFYVDFWCYLVWSWWMIICFWIDIVVKIALIKTFYLRLTRYVLRQFFHNFLIFEKIILKLILNSPLFFSTLTCLIFRIVTYTQDMFSVLNESFFLHKKKI